MENIKETAVFGGGCFWCTEAVFQSLRGVLQVMPGYAGGTTIKPTYQEVCGGQTGHAEVVQITFDPEQINYRDLLTVFFAMHNPTTPGRQANDIGSQYRSAIFYTGEAQKTAAEKFIADLNASSTRGDPVVTEVRPLTEFYPAEEYHRNYYKDNPTQLYCQVVIEPKLEKVQKEFAELLNSNQKNN